MRVVYFGTYESDYPRNRQVIACLRAANVDVLEVHVPVWEGVRHKFSPTLRSLTRILVAQARLLRREIDSAEAIIVGYPGHPDMSTARRAARGRPVVFNPLVSLEDTLVGDRGLVGRRSAKARALRVLDRHAFRSADLVVADTAAHARYFQDHFGLRSDRVAVCFVGAEDRLFHPHPRHEAAHVLFVGKLIPLHGLETILESARLAPEIEFRVVGNGQLDELMKSRPSNVAWQTWLDYERLPRAYCDAACALGIFGTSEKASRVIPNKAFQALATATPLITADTPASRELLVDGESALLVPPGDPGALAAAARQVVTDPSLASRLGRAGYETYRAQASEDMLGKRWRDILESLVGGSVK
jgi:glycosyltransferase involved in cell wall biosynthesis